MLMLPKDPQFRNPAYILALHDERCLFTGQLGCDPMHIGTAGRGVKCHDYWAIPVLHELHLQGHQSGEVTMLRQHMPDWLVRDALRLYAEKLYREWEARRRPR